MRLDLYTTPSALTDAQTKGRLVVVIDVLRASSTIVHACENGVERIIPVAEVEDATRLLPTLERSKALLGGERDAREIEGFDLGNSPLEYPSRVVKGKTLILCTSNGTSAITRSAAASEIVVGSFLNLGAVVTRLSSSRAKSAAILCAGNLGQLSIEDVVCGGLIVERFVSGCRRQIDLNDGAVAARTIAASMPDIGAVVRNSAHGRRLSELGFEDDLEFCSRIDKYGTLPIVEDGRISGPDSLKR